MGATMFAIPCTEANDIAHTKLVPSRIAATTPSFTDVTVANLANNYPLSSPRGPHGDSGLARWVDPLTICRCQPCSL